MKRYWYALIIAFLLVIGISAGVNAQSTPSESSNSANTSYPDRPNYNYLGLLGLLGLYGLHKNRQRNANAVDRKAV